MREILFKAKRVDNNEWVEGCFNSFQGCFIGVQFTTENIDEGKLDNQKWIEVHPETVCQFTGLLDKNCNKIFEGDVIKGTSYLYGYQLTDNKQFDYEGFVKWQGQCDVGLMWILEDSDGSAWHLNQTVHRNCIDYCTGEITSNIHDK